MAKSYVSPGVFTNEVDVSFLGPAVGQIGASLIGMAARGPAFVPVTITSFSEFENWFGDMSVNKDNYLAYAAKAYLKNAPTANIIRVLGPSGRTVNGSVVSAGYTAENMFAITAETGSTGTVCALIEMSNSIKSGFLVTDLGNDLFFISGASDWGTGGAGLTASMLSSSTNYIGNLINKDPTQYSTYGYYLHSTYDYVVPTFKGGNANFSSASLALTAFTIGYNSASSPWITSQDFSGQTYNLFRIHTIGHGETENGRFKISISNITPPTAPVEYGKFDLNVLDFDTDTVWQSFTGLTLDPAASNYIGRAIGDRFIKYNTTLNKVYEVGNFPNQSPYIRVELPTSTTLPKTALPWGFQGLAKPSVASGSYTNIIPDLPYVKDMLINGEGFEGIYWGIESVLSGNIKDRFTWLPSMTTRDADFSLKYVSGSDINTFTYNTTIPASAQKSPGESTTYTSLEPTYAKFIVPMAFGFDGFDRKVADQDAAAYVTNTNQIGTQAFRQAIDIIADPDFIDINLLAIPGIYTSKVVDYGITKIEARADALYVIDITGSSAAGAVSEIKSRAFDTSYACCYFPSIRVNVTDVGVKTVPASIAAIGAIAYNDRVSYPWFAPAGLNRAGLGVDTIGFDVVYIGDENSGGAPNQTERDKLYENRINPIARFPDVPQGVIWGQKTLQAKPSALDRINVRRLLIKAKKLIASSVKYLVFEPGNASTMTRFKQLVNPLLADIQQKQGLEAFQVKMDEKTSPPELIDRNQLKGIIYLIPTRSAEIITIDFVVSPSGATFEE